MYPAFIFFSFLTGFPLVINQSLNCGKSKGINIHVYVKKTTIIILLLGFVWKLSFPGLDTQKIPFYLPCVQNSYSLSLEVFSDQIYVVWSPLQTLQIFSLYILSSVGFTHLQPFYDSCYRFPEVYSWISFYFCFAVINHLYYSPLTFFQRVE